MGIRFLNFSPEGARALANIVSAAMLSFVVFFFSVLLLTVQIASSNLSPRVIARPFRSRKLKASIGLFVLTFVYSMVVVGRGTEDGVGQLRITVVVILSIVSICVFLYIVEHVSKQLRPVTVMADVTSEAIGVIRSVYPLQLAEHTGPEHNAAEFARGAPSRVVPYTGKAGVVLAINIAGLVDVAVRGACTIELVPEVGDFLATGDPVFRLYNGDAIVSSEELFHYIALDRERTLEQDPAFAFRIIVDIAAKALSPAINDPTTAVLALDQIHYLLREVGLRRLDTGLIRDATGRVRLVYRTPDWEDFVGLAVTEIRQFGATSTQVVRRMRAMLEDLIPVLPPNRAEALRHELELLRCSVERGFAVPQDKKRAESADSQGLGGRRKAG